MALPTFTGTGKFGAAGAAEDCPFSAPPAAAAREPLEDGDALPDGDADAEAEGEAVAEGELLGEADEVDTSGATLSALAATSAAGAVSPWPPHADTRNSAPVAASAAENLRDEGSTM
ncbi:hypothetical protein [Streptomyces sp. V1I1]|uniref:hypothetical protein n=1 Tax=Streptomyces sp. V1I1 TaxID=3042272 RepID=UPI0027D8A0F5|nr:hypothetical protein [Streptomyces sp. V1I1]